MTERQNRCNEKAPVKAPCDSANIFQLFSLPFFSHQSNGKYFDLINTMTLEEKSLIFQVVLLPSLSTNQTTGDNKNSEHVGSCDTIGMTI